MCNHVNWQFYSALCIFHNKCMFFCVPVVKFYWSTPLLWVLCSITSLYVILCSKCHRDEQHLSPSPSSSLSVVSSAVDVCFIVCAATGAKHNVIAVKSVCRPAPEGCESKANVLEQQYKSVTCLHPCGPNCLDWLCIGCQRNPNDCSCQDASLSMYLKCLDYPAFCMPREFSKLLCNIWISFGWMFDICPSFYVIMSLHWSLLPCCVGCVKLLREDLNVEPFCVAAVCVVFWHKEYTLIVSTLTM